MIRDDKRYEEQMVLRCFESQPLAGGAWCGNGFHEDGMRSARAACEAIGLDMAKWPAKRRPLGSLSRVAKKFWKWVARQ